MKVLVLTVSDRAAQGVYEDRSGPEIEKILRDNLPGISMARKTVPDEKNEILESFEDNRDMDVIITTGGTGLGPRDVTPEVTGEFCEKLVPGIAEYLRFRSFEETPNAALSRAVAGTAAGTLIINFPGSVRGAAFCAEVISPLLGHAIDMVHGRGH